MFKFLPFKRAKWLFELIFLGSAWVIQLGYTIGYFSSLGSLLSLPILLILEILCFSGIVIGYLFDKEKLMQVSAAIIYIYFLVSISVNYLGSFGAISTAFKGSGSSWVVGTEQIFRSLVGLIVLISMILIIARFYFKIELINDLSILFLFISILILLVYAMFILCFVPINCCDPLFYSFLLLGLIVIISGKNDIIFAK